MTLALAILPSSAMFLDGIGYREQELQQARGSKFSDNEANGLPYVSFGGGTHIFIQGYDFNDDPVSNQILLKSGDLGATFKAPKLTKDDEFNSNPGLGTVAYRLPDLPTLTGQKQGAFDSFTTLRFILSVERTNDFGEKGVLEC